MTKEQIDILWQTAMTTAVKAGEIFTRYEFANLVLEEAAKAIEGRYMGDNNREDMEVKRCADAIRSMKV